MDFKTAKKKGFLITAVIFFALGIVFLSGMLAFLQDMEIKEEDTVEITATIEEINPISFYTITVEGYNGKLGIYSEDYVLDVNELNNLAVGKEITFKIRKNQLKVFTERKDDLEVLSLRYDEKDIITLTSFNAYRKQMQKVGIFGFLGGGVFFSVIGGLFLIPFIKHNREKKGGQI